MKTRCKFQVVGIESVAHSIFESRYEDTMTTEEFEALPGHIWTNGERKYKSVPTGKFAQNIRLAAQYDPSIPEDKRFMEATPTGELKFYVSNPTVVDSFKIGENYYIDLTSCD